MFKDWTYIEAIKQAEHIKAIGLDEVYLYGDGKPYGDYPWRWVTKVEDGGTHRLDISTSIWFIAKDPSGILFRWNFDLEPRSANGSGMYHIDVAGCRRVMSLLPVAARSLFQKRLDNTAAAIEKWIAETETWLRKERKAAADLRRASVSAVEVK